MGSGERGEGSYAGDPRRLSWGRRGSGHADGLPQDATPGSGKTHDRRAKKVNELRDA